MFSDLAYYSLLILSAVVYRLAGKKSRSYILTLAGFAFYTYYAGAAIFLLVLMTIATWLALFWPYHEGEEESQKRRDLVTTVAVIVVSVGVLCWFKYSRFIGTTVGLEGLDYPSAPLAISFFIFEFIHVAAEKRRGTIKYIRFPDYFAFIFFYPTMVAGPIKRFHQFDKGLEGENANSKDVLEGLFRIFLGLFKKMFIADNLNTIITEIGRPTPHSNSMLMTLAVVLYGFRILLDFAGYSDIAIGSARLFGIRVPENFLYPYRQRNPADFWRHWHVSLSSWLTDYVFITVGGNRHGIAKTLRNLMLVMIVSGFWHGAAWNFVLWGVWHGILLTIHRAWKEWAYPKLPAVMTRSLGANALSYVGTMVAVWFGWMLFMWPMDSVMTYLRLIFR